MTQFSFACITVPTHTRWLKSEFEAKHIEKDEKIEVGAVEVPQGQYAEEIIDMLVVVRRRLLTIQVPHKAVEAPQVQFLDPAEDVSVVIQRLALQQQNLEQIVQKTARVSQVQFLDRGMDFHVASQGQVPVPQTMEDITEISQLWLKVQIPGCMAESTDVLV